MRLHDSQESDVGECLKRMREERLLAQKNDEYEKVCHEVEDLQKNFLIQRRLYTEMRAEKLYWEEQYAKISIAGKDNNKIVLDLYQEYHFYKDKHARLAFLANNVIGDIPRSLRDMENVMIHHPKYVEDFLKICRTMVDGFIADIWRLTQNILFL